MPPTLRPVVQLLLLSLVACGGEAPAPAETPVAESAPAPEGVDWSRCRFPGLELPVPGRLFVVDGGEPDPDTEAGRESIRRVDILVPGPVALLLTSEHASVWLLRPSPQTQIRAVFASGPQPQRITGQVLGPAQLARSTALGDDCGRYWLAEGPGETLAEATRKVFGRDHDAVYGLQSGRVVIGDAASLPQVPGPAASAPAASSQAGNDLPPPSELSAASGTAGTSTPAPAPRPAPAGKGGELSLMTALRDGDLRYAHKGDFQSWADRRVEMGAAPLDEAVRKRLLAMPSYIVVRPFTIPASLSGDQAALFLVEPRGEEPINTSVGSLVLGMALGTCEGTGCPPPPPPR